MAIKKEKAWNKNNTRSSCNEIISLINIYNPRNI